MYRKVNKDVTPDRIVRLLLQHLQEIDHLAPAVNTPNDGFQANGGIVFTLLENKQHTFLQKIWCFNCLKTNIAMSNEGLFKSKTTNVCIVYIGE